MLPHGLGRVARGSHHRSGLSRPSKPHRFAMNIDLLMPYLVLGLVFGLLLLVLFAIT
jgi:hypothetical protein